MTTHEINNYAGSNSTITFAHYGYSGWRGAFKRAVTGVNIEIEVTDCETWEQAADQLVAKIKQMGKADPQISATQLLAPPMRPQDYDSGTNPDSEIPF